MTPEKMVELIKNSKVKNESMGPTKGGEWQGRK
jgi:hypothetical protein